MITTKTNTAKSNFEIENTKKHPNHSLHSNSSVTKKRILHLITGLEVGGAEMMLAKVLPETTDHFQHSVCSIVGVGPVGDLLSKEGIAVYPLDLNHKLDLSIIPKFKKITEQIKPDVLITYLPHADLLGRTIGRLARIPTIVCSIRVKLPQSKYFPYFIIDGLTSSLVDRYHFNSEAIATLHKKYLNIHSNKITVIPNAIDSNTFDIAIDRNRKLLELNLPSEKIIIACIARLRKQKGHPILIRAFYMALKQTPNIHLVLVGDGEEKNNVVKLIADLKIEQQVTLLGNRHDIAEILQVIDIFALTTKYEGMSNSIMEAMSATKTILTTDIPENTELLSNDNTALLVPKNNVSKTAAGLVKLVKNQPLRNILAKNAYQRVKNYFQIDVIAEQYREFYSSL